MLTCDLRARADLGEVDAVRWRRAVDSPGQRSRRGRDSRSGIVRRMAGRRPRGGHPRARACVRVCPRVRVRRTRDSSPVRSAAAAGRARSVSRGPQSDVSGRRALSRRLRALLSIHGCRPVRPRFSRRHAHVRDALRGADVAANFRTRLRSILPTRGTMVAEIESAQTSCQGGLHENGSGVLGWRGADAG